MADVIYEVPLGASGSINLGYKGTASKEYRTRSIIVTDPSFRISPATWQQDSSLAAFLQAAAQNDDPNVRIQIIKNIQGAEADNKEATPLSFAYGPDQRIYGDETATIYTEGNTDLISHQLLQQLNEVGGDKLYIRVDEKGQLNGTADAKGNFMGFSASEFFAYNIEGDTGNGVAQRFRIAWANPDENNNGNKLTLPTKVNVNSIENVMSIHLKVIADLNTRVVTLAFMGGGYNFPFNLAERPLLRTALVSNPNLVNFTTDAGVPLTISSATAAFINGMHGVTYTLSATGYPTTGQRIAVTTDAVSQMMTALGIPVEAPETIYLTV